MRKRIVFMSLVWLMSASVASAQQLISADVTRTSGNHYGGSPALVLGNDGDFWNPMLAPFDLGITNFGPFLTSDGITDSGITLEFIDPYWNTWTNGVDNSVFDEYLYLQQSILNANFKISGLDPAGSYTLVLYGIDTGTDSSQFTINGVTKTCTGGTSGDALAEGQQYVTFTGNADANGEIFVFWERITNTGPLSAFQLEFAPGTADFVLEHDPDNNETDVAVDLSDRTIANHLSWTTPNDPNIAEIKGYDIYLDPNITKVSNREGSCLIVASTAGEVTQYDPVTDFAHSETLYWVVDTRYIRDDDPNLGTAGETILIGAPPAWNFTTISAVPSIDTYDSVLTTLSLLPAALSATVTDGDNNLSSAAFTLLTDDVDFPAGATASLQNIDVSNPYAPTAELTTDTTGTYKIRLTVSDGTSTVEDIAQVIIFDNACDAAQVSQNWPGFNYYDRNNDCIVDLSDFVEFSFEWLKNVFLQAPETSPANVEHLPLVNGVINGNFETSDLTGWWNAGGVQITDADPIEGTYSAEWTVVESGSGVTQWINNLDPNAAYQFTVQIEGGTTTTEIQVRNHGNDTVESNPTDGTLQTVTVPFTTGAENTQAEIVVWEIDSGAVGMTMKIDDLRVVPVP